jgi:hypothetical protein
MAADAPKPGGRANTRTILIAALVLAALVAGAIFLFVGGDDDGDDQGATTQQLDAEEVRKNIREGRVLARTEPAPFAMRYTRNWEILPQSQLRSEGDVRPLAGIRRRDQSAAMFVSLGGPVRGGIGALEKRLPGELRSRIPDFKLQTIRRIEVAGGPALYTSWVRTGSGQIQTNLVVPVSNKRSFSIDAIIKPGADEASAEVGGMLRTFDTAPAG